MYALGQCEYDLSIGPSLGLTHGLEEGNTIRNHNLIKVPMLIYLLPTVLPAILALGAKPICEHRVCHS
jgi:hypothetical protein